PDAERNARDEGYEIMTPGDLIEATLVEAATRDARLLLSRDAVKRLLDRLRETDPALVDEAIAPDDRDEARPRRAIAKIHAILRLLLAERVSIRRFDAILEAYNDLVLREDDPNEFRALEYIRVRIGKGIVAPFLSEDDELQAAILAPEWDDELREALRRRDSGEPYLALDSGRAKAFADALRAAGNELDVLTAPRLLLTGGDLRYALSAFARDRGIDWTVVAYDETGQGTRVLRQTFVEWK
ncbi:MAG: FHIPEP family type III secretion protein, partial [Thermoguttaceae bacterium]